MPPINSGKAETSTVNGHDSLQNSLPTNSSPLSISNSRENLLRRVKAPIIEIPVKSPPSGSKVQHVPCKFYKNGACTAGKNCVFSHSKEVQPASSVCKYYIKGTCKFGNKCALQHGNEKKATAVKNGNNLKATSKPASIQYSPNRQRQGFEQRSGVNFDSDPDFLSRSLSRISLDNSFPNFVPSLPNGNLNFYTPQPKSSQLSNIFSSPSPNASKFSMSLPSQQGYPLKDEKFGSNNFLGFNNTAPQTLREVNSASSLSSNIRTRDFLSSDFSFSFSDDHHLLPSSLNELLTPTELQMRHTKNTILSRPPLLNRVQTQNSVNSFSEFKGFGQFDDDSFNFGSSLPSGSSLGITDSRFATLDANYRVSNNSLFSNPNLVDTSSVDLEKDISDGKDDSSSHTSESKKGYEVRNNEVDDDIPFRMDKDF